MKKILLILLSIILITGCNKTKEDDLDKVRTNVNSLVGETFYPNGISDSVDKIGVYEKLENFYEIDTIFNLTKDIIDDFYVKYDRNNNQFYALIKPVQDKLEQLKIEMDNYLVKGNIAYKYEEYENYLIYVVSNNNDLVLKTIKDTKTPIFIKTTNASNDEIKKVYKLNDDSFSNAVVEMSDSIMHANSYIIIKPNEGKKEEIKKNVDEYMIKQEETWKLYMDDQYNLVKNRKFVEYKGYLIYIISNNNDLVFDTIKKALNN